MLFAAMAKHTGLLRLVAALVSDLREGTAPVHIKLSTEPGADGFDSKGNDASKTSDESKDGSASTILVRPRADYRPLLELWSGVQEYRVWEYNQKQAWATIETERENRQKVFEEPQSTKEGSQANGSNETQKDRAFKHGQHNGLRGNF